MKCHRDGCDSEATHGVKAHIRTEGGPADIPRELSFEATIKVCERHQALVESYLLSDHNRQVIHKSCVEEGLGMPIFGSLRIDFVPIERPRVVIETREPAIARCDRFECVNPAKYQVVQKFRKIGAPPRSKPIVQLLTTCCVCEKHRRMTKPADFLDETFRAQTKKRLNDAGILLPDLDNHELDFVKLVGGQRVDPETFATT